MKKENEKLYLMDDIKFFINASMITDEYEMLVVPIIFNKNFTKIKDLKDDKIINLSEASLELDEALMIANEKLCVKYYRYNECKFNEIENNIANANFVINHAKQLNISCKEKKVLIAKTNKNIYSETEINKIAKLISNIYYKRDLLRNEVNEKKRSRNNISRESREF